MPEGLRQRGVTPCPRSGTAAESGAGMAERIYSPVRSQGRRRQEIPHVPKPEARGGSREEKLQAVAVQAQEGLEELSHVEGQEGRR